MTRHDLFGIIDIIALDHGDDDEWSIEKGTWIAHPGGVIGVQSCGTAFSEHYKKITQTKAKEARDWLLTPGTSLELWGWRKIKVKRGGKAMRCEPRIHKFTLDDLKP
jgi:hypothetical protein